MALEKDEYRYIRKKLVKHEKNILNVPEIIGRLIVGLVPFVNQLKENNLSSAQIREVITFIYTWEQTKNRIEYFRNFIRRNHRLLYYFIVDNKIKSYTSTGFQFQTFEAIGLAARTILEGGEQSEPIETADALNSNCQTAAWEENEGDGGSKQKEKYGSERNREKQLDDPDESHHSQNLALLKDGLESSTDPSYTSEDKRKEENQEVGSNIKGLYHSEREQKKNIASARKKRKRRTELELLDETYRN